MTAIRTREDLADEIASARTAFEDAVLANDETARGSARETLARLNAELETLVALDSAQERRARAQEAQQREDARREALELLHREIADTASRRRELSAHLRAAGQLLADDQAAAGRIRQALAPFDPSLGKDRVTGLALNLVHGDVCSLLSAAGFARYAQASSGDSGKVEEVLAGRLSRTLVAAENILSLGRAT